MFKLYGKQVFSGILPVMLILVGLMLAACDDQQASPPAKSDIMTAIPTRAPGSPTEALIKGHAIIWVTNDGGKSWQRRYTSEYDSQRGSTGAEYFFDFICPSSTTCFVEDERQGLSVILSTNDGGNTWHVAPVDAVPNKPNYHNQKGINCLDATHCFRVVATRIDFSSDGGKTWQQQYIEQGGKYAFVDVSCASSSVCVVGGDGGTVVTTIDGGQNWVHQPSTGITENIERISCPSAITCYAYAHTDIKRFGA